MKFTLSTAILAIALVLCFVVAHAEVDSRFDSGSASLATRWQGIKGSLPHEKLPTEASKFKDAGSWGMDYAVGIGKVVGCGFAIAIIALLAGVVYGVFKLVRLCFCGKDDEESSSEETPDRSWCYAVIPTIIYAVAWVFVLTGMIFGLMNNPRFSNGVNDMGDDVISVGSNAVDLGNGVINSVENIVKLIPQTVVDMQAQFAGVDPLASGIVVLSNDINGTSTQVDGVTNEIAQIDAGNVSSVAALYKQLSGINNNSQTIIKSMADLTTQIAVQLQTTVNSTVGSLDSKVAEIDETVGDLTQTARDIIKQATDLVKNVVSYVNDAKSYDKSRGTAVMALFILVIILTICIVFGYIFKIKAIFNVVSAVSIVFIVLLWLSGAIHMLLGMALYDACPVIDVAVKGMLPQGSQAANVLQGCLYEHRSLLTSLNITAYNLTEVFDYKEEFKGFGDFSEKFNFSSIDSYFDSISGLYQYNLTSTANNLTVASFGWNQSYIYSGLDVLNNLTYPTVYTLDNYQTANPNAYSPPKDQSVRDAKTSITDLLALNQTIYNKTDNAKRQMLAAQDNINTLVSSMDALHARFTAMKATINILQTKNISNVVGLLDHLQANITGFFTIGNCSFLGDTFAEVKVSLCNTMQPAIDCLTVGQFLAGLALIPIAIIAEILSFRVPKYENSISDCITRNRDEESGMSLPRIKSKQEREGYAVAPDSPAGSRRHSQGITATIGAAPPNTNSTTDSASNSPDFNSNRKYIDQHFQRRSSDAADV